MASHLVTLVVVLSCVTVALGTYGVDVSDIVYIDDWKCLNNSGYSYGIVRCYESTGNTDPNCPHTIYNAWSGGMGTVDIYMFPCYSCGDAKSQVQATVQFLQSYNCTYKTFWFDIEGPQYWSEDSSENADFMSDLLDEAKDQGQTIGIYTSESQWIPIMGDYTGGSSYPLWYANYDGEDNFDDFSPFGGWSAPVMKQFNGDDDDCDTNIEQNWMP